jgi:hypothetical protein
MSARPLFALVIGMLLVIGATPGCGKKEEPPAKGGAPEGGGKENEKAAQSLGKPDVTMTAEQWNAEWEKDKAAAEAKYKGKVVELSGTVQGADDDPYGQVGYVYLKAKGNLIGVRCATTDKKPWIKVSPGSEAKIRGKVPEAGLPGDLFPAEIVHAGPNPGVVITAKELTKDYAADRAAAEKKYNDKWAYVSGEVAEKTESKFCKVLLKLKGEGDLTVNCCTGAGGNFKTLDALKAGAHVSMYGRLSVFSDPKRKDIGLDMAKLTEAK